MNKLSISVSPSTVTKHKSTMASKQHEWRTLQIVTSHLATEHFLTSNELKTATGQHYLTCQILIMFITLQVIMLILV